MPFSSLVHSTTRTVRRGRRFSFFMRRSASHVTTQPPPSSVAPAPTSHESRWPPTTTNLVRLLAAAQLADDVGRFGVGLEVRLHLQPHDDAVAAIGHALQPIGVLGGDRPRRESAARPAVYCSAPVWGVRSPGGPTERTSAATAPSRAARDGPSER